MEIYSVLTYSSFLLSLPGISALESLPRAKSIVWQNKNKTIEYIFEANTAKIAIVILYGQENVG